MVYWYACAGKGVTIPRAGELVFYFPQGHLEQVDASMKQTASSHMPLYDIPWKILCRVINVELRVEQETDEVYAQVVLIHEAANSDSDQSLDLTKEQHSCIPQSKFCVTSFCKTLTSSDMRPHAGIAIPWKHAEQCLPPLDISQQAPVQELVARDLLGTQWHFQHRICRKSRKHLLQIQDFVTSKKLISGDTIVFVSGDNGELRIGVRRFMDNLTKVLPSVVPIDTMHLGVLENISYAMRKGNLFTVFYRPWTCAAEFIVPSNRYMESIKHCFPGLRFRMVVRREQTLEHSVSGTIEGIEDVDTMWPGSKWRSLKVRWDKNYSTLLPSKVSPWEIQQELRSLGNFTNFGTKRSRHVIDLQEKLQQEATTLVPQFFSCLDAESCLGNAENVVKLCQDSMDQQATLVGNTTYLSAVDDLIVLSMTSSGSSSAANNLHVRAKAALNIATLQLARAFCCVKIWNTNHFKDLDNLPSSIMELTAVDRPSVSSTSSETVLSTSTSGSTGNSSDSGLMPTEDESALQKVMYCLEEKKLDLINTESVSAVQDIASRMIQAGYKESLKETFSELSEDLIRHFSALDPNWIFQRDSRFEEDDSWHGKDVLLKRWTSALNFITKLLVEMERQLYEQDFGAFNELRGDYFSKIAEQPVLKLLKLATASTAMNGLWGKLPEGLAISETLSVLFPRITHILHAYETVTFILPVLLKLVSRETRECISRETEAIHEKMKNAVNKLLNSLTNVISLGVLLETEGSDIHPVTKTVVKGLISLLPYGSSLSLVVARDCVQTHQGLKSLNDLIINVVMLLESILEKSCTQLVPKELQYMFLLNNLNFIHQQVESSVLRTLLRDDWIVQHQQQIQKKLMQYLETSWSPMSSLLSARNGNFFSFWKPSCLQQFTAAFNSAYDIQKLWKVPDPPFRQMLRIAISEKIVPSYREYLAKYPEDEKHLVFTVKDLEDHLLELFQG